MKTSIVEMVRHALFELAIRSTAKTVSTGYGRAIRHECNQKKTAVGYSRSGRTQYKIAVCGICDRHLGVVSSKFLG